MNSETREVLISPGYGAGWSTWNNKSRELAEDPELIRLVKEGLHKGRCRREFTDKSGSTWHEASDVFVDRALEIEGTYPYFGGAPYLEVVQVSGPYRIEEYDGAESIVTMDDMWT